MKPLIGVFAHPDDEAFGPGGTLAKLAKERDVYLICVTNGNAGKNSLAKPDTAPQNDRNLAEIRREEMLASTKILGIKKVFFLSYHDGTLSNNLYHEIAEKITRIIEDIQPDTLLTYEHRGVSGHLDHIAVSFITTYVYEKLDFVKELWYYCTSKKSSETMRNNYFIYFPEGYNKSEVDKVVSTESVWEQKVTAMQCHKSQLHDITRILTRTKDLPKEELFLIRKKGVGNRL